MVRCLLNHAAVGDVACFFGAVMGASACLLMNTEGLVQYIPVHGGVTYACKDSFAAVGGGFGENLGSRAARKGKVCFRPRDVTPASVSTRAAEFAERPPPVPVLLLQYF